MRTTPTQGFWSSSWQCRSDSRRFKTYSRRFSESQAQNATLNQCEERIRIWVEKALEYYRTGEYRAEEIIPTQNYIMGNKFWF